MRRKKTGGRQLGTKNKATQEIKDILDNVVDFDQVIGKLYELSKGIQSEKFIGEGSIVYQEKPDSYAAKILLEYRFGKPLQEIKQENEGGLHIKITRE